MRDTLAERITELEAIVLPADESDGSDNEARAELAELTARMDAREAAARDRRATVARTRAARSDGFDLRDIRARYHRNGFSGEGFSALTFRCRINGCGRTYRQMAAIVFDGPGRIAVIEPANISNRWRGDDFEPLLRSVVQAFGESGELYDREGQDNL